MLNGGRAVSSPELRFAFGENWLRFAANVHADQIVEAETSLSRLLGTKDLAGRSFLDIGCGSGLFSLAARRLGARVRSFDIDPQSVACTQAMRNQHRPNDPDWKVEQGSILDPTFVGGLGSFDIVYSWGVLHHTGDMSSALTRAAGLVGALGTIAVAIYRKTPCCRAWRLEKRIYATVPSLLQGVFRGAYKSAFFLVKALRGENPFRLVREYKSNRGMNWHRDVHDWLGGYPYESTTPATIKQHFAEMGFQLVRSFELPASLGLLGTGCDEFVWRRVATSQSAAQLR